MTFFQLIGDPHYKHKFVLQKIIGHLTGWEREELIVHYDDEIDTELLADIQKKYKLYTDNNEPLEYILWYVEYGGLRFSVNKNTIIPRPETEYMVEAVREYMTDTKESSVVLVDVGTGSGVLWLSLLHSHAQHLQQAFLIDISEDALQVTQSNYKNFVDKGDIDKNIRVKIGKGNLFDVDVIQEAWLLELDPWQEIIVLANLPYIPDETFDTNPDLSIKHEPRVAFVGGYDGLDLYRIMFTQIRESWYSTTMFLEMMTWQVDILRQEFDWLEFEEIKTFHFQIKIVKVMFVR